MRTGLPALPHYKGDIKLWTGDMYKQLNLQFADIRQDLLDLTGGNGSGGGNSLQVVDTSTIDLTLVSNVLSASVKTSGLAGIFLKLNQSSRQTITRSPSFGDMTEGSVPFMGNYSEITESPRLTYDNYTSRLIAYNEDVNNNLRLFGPTIADEGADEVVDSIGDTFNGFAGGTGTQQDPYQIETRAQFQAITNYRTSHFILQNHLDFTGYSNPIDGNGFYPIGGGYSFLGSLDGQGYEIRNVVISGRSGASFGLFGIIGGGATVKKLRIVNISIDVLLHTDGVGALAGYASSCTISECSATGSITTPNGSNDQYGGLIGITTGSADVSDSFSLCSVAGGGGRYFGGFVGDAQDGSFTNCYSAGAVTNINVLTGGFAGSGFGSTATHCYWDTQTSGQASSGLGTGKTTALMKKQTTFENWDFNTIWAINEDLSYPYFVQNPTQDKVHPILFTAQNIVSSDANLVLNQDNDILILDGAFRLTGQIISSLETGTKPISVISTTECTNLNAQLWGGNDSNALVAQGDILYGSALGVVSNLAKIATATRYLSNTGTNNNPAWSQVNLADGVTGTLLIANGGTNITSYAQGDILYASGANTLAKLAKGTSGKFLKIGATIPSWESIGISDISDIATNYLKLNQSSAQTITASPVLDWLSASQAVMTDASKKLISVDYLDQAVKTTSSPTFAGLTNSALTSGRIVYAGTGGLLTDSANLTFNGTDMVCLGSAAIGSAISSSYRLSIQTPKYALNTTGSRWAFSATAKAQATANTSNALGGFVGGAQTYGTFNYTGTCYGLLGQFECVGTGTCSNVYGLWGKVVNFNAIASTIINAASIRATIDAEDGTITSGYLFKAETGEKNTGSIGTLFAFYDSGQTAGSTNWGLGINTQSYVNANLSIGKNTAPTAALDVFGDGKFSSTVQAGGYKSSDGSVGLSGTYNFDGSAAGTVSSMTFKNGILTDVTIR